MKESNKTNKFSTLKEVIEALYHIDRRAALYSLNKQLKQSDTDNKINLNDYSTKDIDFTGCDPVIAEALKKNKSILCKVRDIGGLLTQQYNVVSYRKGRPYPYVTTGHNVYKHAEPIKKKKTELRVKDPVSIMQYLTDNNWSINKLGQFVKKNNCKSFDFRDISFCGQVPPEDWQWPELLEEVAVKCE